MDKQINDLVRVHRGTEVIPGVGKPVAVIAAVWQDPTHGDSFGEIYILLEDEKGDVRLDRRLEASWPVDDDMGPVVKDSEAAIVEIVGGARYQLYLAAKAHAEANGLQAPVIPELPRVEDEVALMRQLLQKPKVSQHLKSIQPRSNSLRAFLGSLKA